MAAAVSIVAGPVVPAYAHPGSTIRVSHSSTQANGDSPASSVADTTGPQISLDGTCTAFSSDATNLVARDTNGKADVFVRDSRTGAIRRASVTRSGAQANGSSHSPSVSVDCRYLAFVSDATNLVGGDRNGVADVFLKDLTTGAVQLVSVTSSERQANGPSFQPFVSLFGQWIVFESDADNIDARDDNAHSDVFIRDVKTGRTERVPWVYLPTDEGPGYETFWTQNATISYDGRYVAFTRAGARADSSMITSSDVFVLDRRTRKQYRIPAKSSGDAKTMTDHPAISADGRYVALEVWSSVSHNDTVKPSDAIDNDDGVLKNPVDPMDIWMWDRYTKRFVYLSVNGKGLFGNGDSSRPSIAANGHKIAFVSEATNLVAGDTNGVADVFVRDLSERTTSRMSVDRNFGDAAAASTRPSMTYEGRRVAFASVAGDFVTGDSNEKMDVFLRDRRTDLPNRAPNLRKPVEGTRVLNIGEQVTLRLRATDADRDRLRYAAMAGLPSGATIDPVSGMFSWKPDPTHNGKRYAIALWAEDPRGGLDLEALEFYVRTTEESMRCEFFGQCRT